MATTDVKNRAAAYLRVSTKEQNEERQLPDILKQASNDGYTIPEHFIFRDQVSGLKNETEREALLTCDCGRIMLVVVVIRIFITFVVGIRTNDNVHTTVVLM